MAKTNWSTQARIVLNSRSSQGFGVLFWLWGVAGFIIVTILFMSMPASVGVGTSAYVSTCILYWMGGMILFGLAAIVGGGNYDFMRRDADS